LNVAVTVVVEAMVTGQAPVPEQGLLQPAKVEPAPAAALRVTAVPDWKVVLHRAPQSMPAGEEVTVPVPVPTFTTVRVVGTGTRVKEAVTVWAVLMVTTHDAVPEQAPLQPEKVEPDAGVAVSVTAAGARKPALQVGPQLRPVGEEVTVPVPVPALPTVSVYVVGLPAS
jgi:hypothetical protein